MKALIKRNVSDDKQTIGVLSLYSEEGDLVFECNTLELKWNNNRVKDSCIPTGSYKVVPRTSSKFGKHFHVLDVPNRSWILFHSGNYYTQIEGCILVGTGLADINNDGYTDVTNSKAALKELLEKAPKGFTLEIV